MEAGRGDIRLKERIKYFCLVLWVLTTTYTIFGYLSDRYCNIYLSIFMVFHLNSSVELGQGRSPLPQCVSSHVG